MISPLDKLLLRMVGGKKDRNFELLSRSISTRRLRELGELTARPIDHWRNIIIDLWLIEEPLMILHTTDGRLHMSLAAHIRNDYLIGRGYSDNEGADWRFSKYVIKNDGKRFRVTPADVHSDMMPLQDGDEEAVYSIMLAPFDICLHHPSPPGGFN